MLLTGNAFLNDKLRLWQTATLSVFPPPDVEDGDWYDLRERTYRFYIVFGDSELMRDDNPEGRDTRADIKRWGNLLDGVRILVPPVCGVIVFGLVYIVSGFVVLHRERDEA